MGTVGKTLGMVVGALALLLALGFADPGNRRLMPSFFSTDPPPGIVPKGSYDEAAILHAITQFNSGLSSAYRALDPAALERSPMDESLRRHFVEEIEFLRNDGRALEMTVQDIRISQVRRLADLTLNVSTVETVGIRYLGASNGKPIVAQPESRYAMSYALDKSASGYTITAFETLEVGSRDD